MLIGEFQAGNLDAETFCSQFERTYNLELDEQTLSPAETEALRLLVRLHEQGQLRRLRGKLVWEGDLEEMRRARFEG